ncbi:hypothetical protein L1887_17434 [Cichorium endivia]|nr:hypothetical protein L1887_17434 [Cichorium endivia]
MAGVSFSPMPNSRNFRSAQPLSPSSSPFSSGRLYSPLSHNFLSQKLDFSLSLLIDNYRGTRNLLGFIFVDLKNAKLPPEEVPALVAEKVCLVGAYLDGSN